MAAQNSACADSDEQPLISGVFLYRLTAVLAILASMTLAISYGGRLIGERMALGEHSESIEEYTVAIGEDALTVAANAIRFPDQRADGEQTRLDLTLTWPAMQGYSRQNRHLFNDLAYPSSLIFLQLSQSTMSRDMSGRMEPIYRHLIAGNPEPAPHGLTLHRLKPDEGYAGEVLLTAPRKGQPDYVVRCLLPAEGHQPTGGDCQRDIRLGNDLSVLYRFSSARLSDWDHIDAAITSFVETRLSKGETTTGKEKTG